MRFRSIFVICLVLAERWDQRSNRTSTILLFVILNRSTQEDDAYLDFPEDFKIGAGGSSYQIEGAWNISGIHLGINKFDTVFYHQFNFHQARERTYGIDWHTLNHGKSSIVRTVTSPVILITNTEKMCSGSRALEWVDRTLISSDLERETLFIFFSLTNIDSLSAGPACFQMDLQIR